MNASPVAWKLSRAGVRATGVGRPAQRRVGVAEPQVPGGVLAHPQVVLAQRGGHRRDEGLADGERLAVAPRLPEPVDEHPPLGRHGRHRPGPRRARRRRGRGPREQRLDGDQRQPDGGPEPVLAGQRLQRRHAPLDVRQPAADLPGLAQRRAARGACVGREHPIVGRLGGARRLLQVADGPGVVGVAQ
jgi:hypothetical protein